MKNLIIKIFIITICMFSLNLQAQVSPVNKEMANKLEQQKRDYKRQQELARQQGVSFEKQDKPRTYLELTIISLDTGISIEEIGSDFSEFSYDKKKSEKAAFIKKIPELLQKGSINLVSEFGKQGIRIISHSFIAIKKGEKHIYILEL